MKVYGWKRPERDADKVKLTVEFFMSLISLHTVYAAVYIQEL